MIGATQEADMDKTAAAHLTHATLAFGAETTLANCTNHIDLSRAIAVTLRVEMTYAADVDVAPTVSIYASHEAVDGSYDTAAWKTWTFPLDAGETVTMHWPDDDKIDPLPKFIKVLVKNNSTDAGADDITSITVIAEPLNL